MKKIIFIFLIFILSFTAVCAQDEAEDEYEAGINIQDRLTVGNTTPMHGKFFTEMWEDVTSDGDVRSLIHGYNLIMWDGENGVFTHDPSVVNAIGIRDNENGDRTYLIALQDNLYYSDGTKITAWDYAFSALRLRSTRSAAIRLKRTSSLGIRNIWTVP